MNKAGGLTIPNFESYSKDMVIDKMWYQWQIDKIGQWNRIESK